VVAVVQRGPIPELERIRKIVPAGTGTHINIERDWMTNWKWN